MKHLCQLFKDYSQHFLDIINEDKIFWNTISHIFLYLQINVDFSYFFCFREFLPMKLFTDLVLPFAKSLATSG